MEDSAERSEAYLEEDSLCAQLNGHDTVLGQRRVIRRALIHWYQDRALSILRERLDIYTQKLGVTCSKFALSNASRRWGSCNLQGTIRLNWRIVMATVFLIDYVVAHELCHLVHLNHSWHFWDHLGSIMPDYKERRRWLRQEGYKFCL